MRFCTVVVTAALFFPIVCPLAAQQPPPLEPGEGVRVSRACRERVLSTGQRRTDCRRDAGTLTSLSSGAVVFRIDEGTGFAQRTTLEGMIRDTVLSNGLAVIAVRNPVIPAVTVEIAFRNGAFTQLELEEEGLPHLIEHVLFKAYGRGDWSSRVAGLDGMSNATTGVETVTYYIIAPPENLGKAVELLSRLVRRPTFERNDLENEKRVVKNELERDAADPFHLLNFHTDRVLFGPAFRQKNPRGNLFSIQGTTTRMLQDHHERYYVPNNAALVVTGDISPEEVFEVAREHLDGWDREADPFEGFTHPPVRPLTRDSIFVIRTDAPNVTLSVAWQGPSVNEDPEGAVAADLFSEIVTQRVSGAYSRLVDSGLYHFLSFSYSPSNHVGPIKLVARTVPEKVAAAATALRLEISLMENPFYFQEEELQIAKTSLRVQAAHGRESAISFAHTLARKWSLGGVDHFERTPARESELGQEVKRFISRYIVGRPRALIMMVSPSTIDAHEEALIAALNAWLGQ